MSTTPSTSSDDVDASIEAPGYVQKEFVREQFGDVLAAAAVVVSRAGANSLYELLVTRKHHPAPTVFRTQIVRQGSLHNALRDECDGQKNCQPNDAGKRIKGEPAANDQIHYPNQQVPQESSPLTDRKRLPHLKRPRDDEEPANKDFGRNCRRKRENNRQHAQYYEGSPQPCQSFCKPAIRRAIILNVVHASPIENYLR